MENQSFQQQFFNTQSALETYSCEKHPLGAAARLKADLPYVLGKTIISHVQSVWKIFFLPLSLWFAGRNVRRDQKLATCLIPIAAYADFEEAQKTRKHLSYRLGKVWLKNIHTPWGWVWMPFALIRAYVKFREDRRVRVMEK